ncbi:MAG: methyltransferase [Helicobacter sp.]|nr:methyltransferase [Helicobacter sp.]
MALLKIYQDKNGYSYNTDSLLLYGFIYKILKTCNSPKDLLDVGANTGILGLLALRDFDIFLESIELEKDAFFLLSQNAKKYPKIKLINADFLTHKFNKKYDVIISNPPFYGVNKTPPKSHKMALARSEKYMPIDAFLKRARDLMYMDSNLIFCFEGARFDEVKLALKNAGFFIKTLQFVHSKPENMPNLALIHAVLFQSEITLLPPLYVQNTDGLISKEAKEIYTHCNTYSIKVSL